VTGTAEASAAGIVVLVVVAEQKVAAAAMFADSVTACLKIYRGRRSTCCYGYCRHLKTVELKQNNITFHKNKMNTFHKK